MSHGPHPLILDHGLADECDRCTEIAADPFLGLDDDNLAALIERTLAWMRDEEFPRSQTETDAMRVMEKTLVRVRHMERLGLLEWLGVTA